mmetsp:Transcript_58680/g.174633  ORF Transcript_58680/g.174633 Transcript_58680/m.174633 type:complete len:363 (-) Transcript_58680:609-1697(-)|eukprot:CAMPEP_0113563196 /NCGR_PEP_ID=MMETSP0015_2-20120614/20935_1 /TAXON_ID=2838 /ORGANISM="Odontella" /LENGTH=362 /DNA_ID=CAMNT_0000465151 /DNA_START=108 /DNA_END=1196 /DNA_ORIENTATION=+ /assembly_acc=CAM_ASM_000160
MQIRKQKGGRVPCLRGIFLDVSLFGGVILVFPFLAALTVAAIAILVLTGNDEYSAAFLMKAGTGSPCDSDQHLQPHFPVSLRQALDEFEKVTLSEVSKVVWQTWKTSELIKGSGPYDHVEIRLKPSNPEYDFVLMNDTEVDDFMRTHFRGRIYDAFRLMNPAIGAMRADLWRYCVLYVYGGVYLDLDSGLKTPLSQWGFDDNAVLEVEDNDWTVAYHKCRGMWSNLLSDDSLPERVAGEKIFAQWILTFPLKRHPILWETIRLVTEHIHAWKDTNYTTTLSTRNKVLCLTGPPVFSTAIQKLYAMTGNWTKMRVMAPSPEHTGRAVFKVFQWASINERHYGRERSTVPMKVNAATRNNFAKG